MAKHIWNEMRRRAARLHRLLPVTNTAGAEAEGPKKWTVSGSLVDNAAAALAGVAVTLDQGGSALFSTTSAAVTGAWSIANVPNGTYNLTYTLATYEVTTAVIVVAGTNLAVGEIEINSLWSIGGVVTDSDAAFIAVDVYLWDNDQYTGDPLDMQASIIGDGTFTFDDVVDGTYYLQFVRENYTPADDPLEVVVSGADVVDADQVVTADFRNITGSVEDSLASAMAGVTIKVYDPIDLETVLYTTETDGLGAYSVAVAQPAFYYVTAGPHAGYTFAPTYINDVEVNDADATGNDFVGTADV